MAGLEPRIFETIFPRRRFEASLDAVAALGLGWVQFDLASAGPPTLPAAIPAGVTDRIRRETAARGIRIAAVAGTYNMIHPDPAVRAAGLTGLHAIAAACAEIGAPLVTLCTGTRDPDSMWRAHPANRTPEAWNDLLAAMTAALAIADEHDVLLGVEPEPANVAGSAALARDLLRDLDHPRLKIIFDPANILAADRTRPPETVLDNALALLGEHIALAHAKDLSADGEFCTAGTGIVPWDHCLAHLRTAGYAGPLILHTLTEPEAPAAVAFLRERVAASGSRRAPERPSPHPAS